MKRKSRVNGAYPKTLYRCFDKEEYAVQFVEEGKFRISSMEYYKSIECVARRDTSEGEGVYLLKGPVVSGRVSKDPGVETQWFEEEGIQRHHTEFLRPVFLFCCSNVSVNLEALKARFGKYIVKIVSPVSLAIEIDYFLNGENGEAGPYSVGGVDVEYNKELLIDDGRTSHELADLAYTQKPKEFAAEKEYRFCLMALGTHVLPGERTPMSDHIFVDLGSGRNSYAQMLKRDF